MQNFLQQAIEQEPIVVIHDLSTTISDALDGKPFFTIFPKDTRKDLSQRYNAVSEIINNYYAYVTHPKIESYLLEEEYLQSHAGEAIEYKANLAWLNRDVGLLFEILFKDFPAIDKKYRLLVHVLNIDYYYHEISRYAVAGDAKKAFQLLIN